MAQAILRAAVVGGSTLLGRELLNEIANSAAAVWDLRLLEEGEESEGQLSAAGDEALVVHSLNQEAFTGLDAVFFASRPELTTEYLEAATRAGAAIVDLSGATADRAGFVLRSPWISSSQRADLTTTGVCVPHPAALMLALVAERLARSPSVELLAATVLEPASQAGSAGVDELHQQTVSLLSFQDVPKAVFDAQVAFNVQGELGAESEVNLRAVAERLRTEVNRLLGEGAAPNLELQLLQAPVFHGYVASVFLRLREAVGVEAVGEALAGAPVVLAKEVPASNRSATETGDLMVSVTGGDGQKTAYWLLLAADNLGLMARSAVGAAMELAALRPSTRVQ